MNKYEISLERIKKNVFPTDDWTDEDREHLQTVMDALEKQIPKKPIANYIGIETDAKCLCCPACRYQDECDFEDLQDYKYTHCPMCGQAFDWGDDDGN